MYQQTGATQMQHKAHMNNKNLICSGYKVANDKMSEGDLVWAKESSVIKQDENGQWFHSLITDRDRKYRQSYWKPDTGMERYQF